MELGRFFKKFLFKMYNIGAAIVLSGLLLQMLGYKYSSYISIAGLFCECMIFLLSSFLADDGVDSGTNNNENQKTNENSKFKKIYYTDGNGYYFLDKPNAVAVGAGPSIYGGGILPARPEVNNIGPVYAPDINSQINNLREQLEFLEDIRNEQIKSYMVEKNKKENSNNESSKNSNIENNSTDDAESKVVGTSRKPRRVGRISRKKEQE